MGMSINSYLKTELPTKEYAQEPLLDSFKKYLHDHPRIISISKAVLGSHGLYIALKGLCNSSAGISPIVRGALEIAIAATAHKTLGLVLPTTHDPKSHTFEPGKCKGVTLAYEGDIPVLTIPNDKPYDGGYGQGYLCFNQVNPLLKETSFALHTLGGFPRPEKLSKTLEKIKKTIPKKNLREMEGFVAGYNAMRNEMGLPFQGPKLTMEIMLLSTLLPEKRNLDCKKMEEILTGESPTSESVTPAYGTPGCTVIFGGNAETGPIVARGTDWPSLNLYGELSLLKKYVDSRGRAVRVDLCLPNQMGSVNGTNGKIFAALHTSPGNTEEIKNPPVLFYIQTMLETCNSIEEVKTYMSEHKPLGACNISVADDKDAIAAHFFDNEEYEIIDWEEEKFHFTTNYNYQTNKPTTQNCVMREKNLQRFFDDLSAQNIELNGDDAFKVLETAINLPHVNSDKTLYRMFFRGKTHELWYATDNGWAGDQTLQEVPIKKWFNL